MHRLLLVLLQSNDVSGNVQWPTAVKLLSQHVVTVPMLNAFYGQTHWVKMKVGKSTLICQKMGDLD